MIWRRTQGGGGFAQTQGASFVLAKLSHWSHLQGDWNLLQGSKIEVHRGPARVLSHRQYDPKCPHGYRESDPLWPVPQARWTPWSAFPEAATGCSTGALQHLLSVPPISINRPHYLTRSFRRPTARGPVQIEGRSNSTKKIPSMHRGNANHTLVFPVSAYVSPKGAVVSLLVERREPRREREASVQGPTGSEGKSWVSVPPSSLRQSLLTVTPAFSAVS